MVYGGWTVIMGYMGGASIFLLESCQLWCNSTRAFYFPCNPVLPSRIDYLWHALAQANHYFGFHALLSSCGRCPLAVLSPFSTDASPQELWPNCLAVINLPLPFLFPSLSSAVHTSLASITNLFFHISCRLSLWSLCWWCMVPGIFFTASSLTLSLCMCGAVQQHCFTSPWRKQTDQMSHSRPDANLCQRSDLKDPEKTASIPTEFYKTVKK